MGIRALGTKGRNQVLVQFRKYLFLEFVNVSAPERLQMPIH